MPLYVGRCDTDQNFHGKNVQGGRALACAITLDRAGSMDGRTMISRSQAKARHGCPIWQLTVTAEAEQIENVRLASRERACRYHPQLRRTVMFEPATQSDIDRYERAVDGAIATCGGDLRGALKALIIANEYLEEELRQVLDLVSEQPMLVGIVFSRRNVA